MEEILMELEGAEAILRLYTDKLIISPNGIIGKFSRGSSSEKTIYLNQITGIQFKRGSILNGFLRFTIPGALEGYKKGMFDDPNTMFFKKKDNDLAESIKNKIEELQRTQQMSSVQQTTSVPDEIKKYKELLDSGIITQEEFDTKKNELLNT